MLAQKICIIPARGGSKRIPRKNIRLFHGKPMIAWSIEVAINSQLFDQVLVSTDDHEIAEISIACGAEVPFIRPAELSDDFATTTDVIQHAIHQLSTQIQLTDHIFCLYATAPFVQVQMLEQAFDLFNSIIDASVVFTATSYSFPIQRAIRIDRHGYSSPFDQESISKRSQDLEEFFHDAGQFYLATADSWLKSINIFDRGTPLLLPRFFVQDIDTEEDWAYAEMMYSLLKSQPFNLSIQ